MDPHAASPLPSVSNLVPVWEDVEDGGGSFEPAAAATIVEQVVHGAGERRARGRAERPVVTPPATFDPTEPVSRPTGFSYSSLDEPDVVVAGPELVADDELSIVDYDALRRRDIARELLRARLVAMAEQREHRTAYEIVFILLAASVAILLAAPPLVQVLLAARGIQA